MRASGGGASTALGQITLGQPRPRRSGEREEGDEGGRNALSWPLLRFADGRWRGRRVERGVCVRAARRDQIHGALDRDADEAPVAIDPGVAVETPVLLGFEAVEVADRIGLQRAAPRRDAAA